LIALSRIQGNDINPDQAHGTVVRERPDPKATSLGSLLRQRPLLVFAAGIMMLQLANASMLPLMAGVVTARSPNWAPALIAASREILEAPDPRTAARALGEALRGRESAPVAGAIRALARGLYEAGCIRFGDFVLKSGQRSSIYLDLRRLVAFPALLEMVAGLYAAVLERLAFDRLAAIPYAALPIGTAVALRMRRPLLYPRREAKAYGTGQRIEGEFHPGEAVAVLDDVLTTGASKWEAIRVLEEAGLRVTDIVVLVDREQGGRPELEAAGYRVHAVTTLNVLLDALVAEGRLLPAERDRIREALRRSPAAASSG